ncbi:MAG: enoyl-CoA hydratase/isomerase family protein [Ideonella sp.]|nr:enoyl-CoA hydratase/isomerase family protein [Ideonella sp.]MCC7457452.1 enoyl-CoA hydratase/isomerase family protein [Nitrospira sp.]
MTLRRVPLATTAIAAEVDEGGIGWLRIDRPERRNAVSLEMWQGLADAAAALDADDTVRVVVIHGVGGRSFSAGADIGEFAAQRADAEQRRRYGAIAARGHDALAQLNKPLIAMVQGWCLGGGLGLALQADLRFAADDARFGIPAARLGLGYDYAGLVALARLIGASAAKDMLFSARRLDAAEALRIGLVNAVFPAGALEAEVHRYATGIAANAPLTLHACKVGLREFERGAHNAQAEAIVATLVDRCFDSADYREGRTAFVEKREPRFGRR